MNYELLLLYKDRRHKAHQFFILKMSNEGFLIPEMFTFDIEIFHSAPNEVWTLSFNVKINCDSI